MTFDELRQWVFDQTEDEPEVRARLVSAIAVLELLEETETRRANLLASPDAR